jgi:hypothetical protein
MHVGQDERRRANTIGYWVVFAACQGLGVALPLAANVHDNSVVLAFLGWFLLLPGILIGAVLGSSDRIPTAVIYLLVIAANLIVWCGVGTKLRAANRPR